jgi:hypothetical protein
MSHTHFDAVAIGVLLSCIPGLRSKIAADAI